MSKTYYDVVDQWKKRNINTTADLEKVLSNFSILFAYNSGAIENPEINYHTTREIFENGKIINFTGDVRTIFEIKNQKLCYDWLKIKIIQREPLTPELIKKIHKQLTSGTYDEKRYSRGERPGEYKKHDYVIGNDQGALPEEVPVEIEELCDEMQNIPDKGDNIIKAAAYLHCKFENTHPFADGNGRVGRTLMNYFLMINNYPPVVVRNQSKDEYYKALEIYDKTGELDPFVSYIKKETEITWNEPQQVKKKLNDYLKDDSVLAKLHSNQEKLKKERPADNIIEAKEHERT